MNAIRAYYNGTVFIPIEPVKANKNQQAIITILDTEDTKAVKPHLKYVGILSRESLEEIEKVLLDTQKVDENEW